MARICRKCLQVGIIVGFGVFLVVCASKVQVPSKSFASVEPQLTAGASKLPMVEWQKTEIKVVEPEPEINAVAEPITEPVEEVVEAPTEPPEPQETASEPQEIDDIDLLYRTVQAEGYTMGFEGMRYITDAILNLARYRGCSVYEVLTSGVYTVVNNGQIWRETLYQDTIDAVNAELGGQLDYEIKYFRTNHFHGFGTPQFAYGNVYFSS